MAREQTENTDREPPRSPRIRRIKHVLDRLLIVALAVVPGVLYLEFLADSTHVLYPYKGTFQLLLIAYFLAELGVDFLIYRRSQRFFRERWTDILLTLPFFTAYRSLSAVLRALSGLKTLVAGQTEKSGKGAKLSWKNREPVTKGKKRLKHLLPSTRD